MNEEQRKHDQLVREIQAGMSFATGFANVLVKLRTAESNLHGVSLQHSEVKAILEGFRLLKDGAKREPR